MKGLKTMLLGAIAAPLLASCIDGAENSQSGFALSGYSGTAYANTPKGYVTFLAYDAWTLKLTGDTTWVTPSLRKGKGYTIYSMPVTFSTNATHEARSCSFGFSSNTGDGSLTLPFIQYGTRGDGSWGDAPLVKEISGDDGSLITLTYDNTCRPTSIKVAKGDNTCRQLSFAWTDSLVTVGGDDSYSVAYASGYQLPNVTASTDTLSYVMGADIYSFDYVGQLGESRTGKGWLRYFALYKGQLKNFYINYYSDKYSPAANWPDLDRKADSIKYDRHYADGTVLEEYMAMTYGSEDNRHQSVDANQLLLGVEECNPYLLLGLYRNLRCTAIVREATSKRGKRTVATTLNADKSVNTLTVTDPEGGKVTYTFSY